MTFAHRRASTLAILFAFLAAALVVAGTAGAKKRSIDYVALGDSYAAAPGVPNQIAVHTPPGCGQSDANYPHLLAALSSRVDLTDVTCGGATTVHMTNPQPTAAGTAPPQFDALSKQTDVVTVTIGGNDIGFGSIVSTCVGAFLAGGNCKSIYTAGGTDQLQQRIADTAPKIDAVLDGIKQRSPHAKVVVVGYPAILPGDEVCNSPQMPFAPSDTPYLDGVERSLNAMLADQARRNHARYADSYAASVGHDACKPADVRWVEPVVAPVGAIPVHPNAKGEQAMARATLRAARHHGRSHRGSFGHKHHGRHK